MCITEHSNQLKISKHLIEVTITQIVQIFMKVELIVLLEVHKLNKKIKIETILKLCEVKLFEVHSYLNAAGVYDRSLLLKLY